jgi:hypothetical protein
MAKNISYSEELRKLQNYIESDSNEDAKRHLLYPIFQKLFKDKFKIESDANNVDGYVEGQLIIEAKSNYSQWVDGFYQALHYRKKYGLSYNTILVIAHEFCGIWKVKNLPEYAVILSNTADPSKAPSEIGKLNASKTTKAQRQEIIDASQYWLEPKDFKGTFDTGKKSMIQETFQILKVLNNIDSERIQVNKHNFIEAIERMKLFFPTPIEAVHAFYSIIPFWDITSHIAESEQEDIIKVIGFSGKKFSEDIAIKPQYKKEFIKFVETQYIFTNEGSGLTVDYYFSRFDEVLAKIDPEYVKQHGIFFTDDNLSKFALWFAKNQIMDSLDENYVVFDPAGGSGNLISSYRGKLKHKIISELQPDLLKIIEKRMKADPWHIEKGFTIVPKTTSQEGLNFLDRSAADYYAELEKAVKASTNKEIDKPLAFLLNPPYKNTDENASNREEKNADYEIHPDILELTGADAGKERYLAFLGQIMKLCEVQVAKMPDAKPLVMIFTPTSWLVPRPTYVGFRKKWDKQFKYLNGFITTSNEFFKLQGKWPLAFTIWEYNPSEDRTNEVEMLDLTELKKSDLSYNWLSYYEDLDPVLLDFLKKYKRTKYENKINIKETLNQRMYDFKRSPTKTELNSNEIYGGLPIKDERRKNLKTYGISNSKNIGFMEDCVPVRIKKRENDISFEGDINNKIWFLLQKEFKNINSIKCHNGPTDQKSYCAFDLYSSQKCFSWYAIAKSSVGKYPTWANQLDLWAPEISEKEADYWYALCFAFGLAENRCVVSKFEADNPVAGAPEVFVDNPMSPNNEECFYRTTLSQPIEKGGGVALELKKAIDAFYQYWNKEYTKGQILEHVGLKDEAYFRYFDYPDFVTKDSGLVQIKKYADINGCSDLISKIQEIQSLTKKVKEEIYRLLVLEFKYFG